MSPKIFSFLVLTRVRLCEAYPNSVSFMNQRKFPQRFRKFNFNGISFGFLGFSGALLTALFLALVARKLELSTSQKYFLRLVTLAEIDKKIKNGAAAIIQYCMHHI